jgi:hypothetical protein
LTATGLVMIFFLSKSGWRRRLIDCALFGGISILPVFLWLRRNASVSGTLTNRVFSLHLMSAKLARVYVAEVASWFVPRILGLPRPIRNLLVALLALPWPALFLLRYGKELMKKADPRRRPFWALPWTLVLNSFFFVVILVVNTTLLDASTPVSAPPRYLMPVFVSVVILFAIALFRLLQDVQAAAALRIAPLAYGLLLILLYALESMPLVKNPLSAIGYLGYIEQRPKVMRALQNLDPEAPIISNNPEMVYAFINRPAYMWPIEFDHYVQEEREDFDAQLDATREKLEEGGVLVVFGWPVGTETLVFDVLETERLETFIDVTLLGYPEAFEGE